MCACTIGLIRIGDPVYDVEPFTQVEKWRLDSRSTLTFGDPILKLEFALPACSLISKPQKTYRNPIIYAMELKEEMRRERLTQAELSRKLRISRERRVVTERRLRGKP